ncbi:hypothetical protein L3V82_09975 [Thiotrichales bacterium 19S3-7]|nr:hypothetical protein [Thiotrichales bacterium 19S3-7]MCF6802486.1 hypothetical protein [Thiotrichales bacterium 19S3-11]
MKSNINILESIRLMGVSAKATLLKIKNIFLDESENSKAVLETYGKYALGKANADEMEQANKKFRELLKAAGLGALCLIPGTVVTLPLILYAAKKLKIDILPPSFYKEFPGLKEAEKDK